MSTPVLFTRADSPYLALGADCYDIRRDARTWPGGRPGIFHPPCRTWGNYAHRAKARPDERELAVWAMRMVRRFGGVLEHPITSKLWRESSCLGWGIRDQYGGVLVTCAQSAFGHRAQKYTGLYIVGASIPEVPSPGVATNTVENMGRSEREATPPALAAWLLELVGTIQ